MKIYWSQTFLAVGDVSKLANALEVNPTVFDDDSDSFWIIKDLLNGETAENNVGKNTLIAFVVSADQMHLVAKVGVNTKTIEEWMYEWEDTKFRWVSKAGFNNGDPIRVKMKAKPVRARVSSESDLREFQYALVTSPFIIL